MATITVSNTGGNWNATGTWVGGVVPLSTDTVAFTATSGNLTVNVASTCAGFDMTNYSAGKTITFTSTLTINGPWNLGSGAYIQAGAGGVIMGASGTITSNGVTWSRTLTLQGTSQTYTLAGDITTSGLLTFSPSTAMAFVGAYNINVLGGLTVSGPSGTISGASTPIIIKGGTWNHTVASYINNNVTINPSTTVILGANQFFAVGTLTYTAGAGSVTTGIGTLSINANCTLNTNVMVWNNITLSATNQTFTLGSDLNVGGLLTLSPSTAMAFVGAYNINVLGGLTVSGVSTAVISGASTPIIIKGGTWNHVLATYINNNVTINPTTTVTLGANIFYAVGTLTYSSSGGGSFVPTGNTLTCNNSVTFNTSGITFNNVTINGASTVTLSSAFSCNTLQLNNYAVTFAGGYGFSVGSLVGSGISGKTITLVSSNTYSISTAFTFNTGTSAAHNVFKSSTGGVKAILTLQNGASQDLSFVDFTDIDASLGKTLCTYKGTIATSDNIRLLPTDFITVSY